MDWQFPSFRAFTRIFCFTACGRNFSATIVSKLRESGIILVGFDRPSMPMHAGRLTREGLGHAGIVLFRRSVSAVACGRQARLLLDFWREAEHWGWTDRIEYFPRS